MSDSSSTVGILRRAMRTGYRDPSAFLRHHMDDVEVLCQQVESLGAQVKKLAYAKADAESVAGDLLMEKLPGWLLELNALPEVRNTLFEIVRHASDYGAIGGHASRNWCCEMRAGSHKEECVYAKLLGILGAQVLR